MALDDDDHVQLNTYAFDFGWLLFICALSKRPNGQVKVAKEGSLFVFKKLKTPQFYFFKGQSRRPEES